MELVILLVFLMGPFLVHAWMKPRFWLPCSYYGVVLAFIFVLYAAQRGSWTDVPGVFLGGWVLGFSWCVLIGLLFRVLFRHQYDAYAMGMSQEEAKTQVPAGPNVPSDPGKIRGSATMVRVGSESILSLRITDPEMLGRPGKLTLASELKFLGSFAKVQGRSFEIGFESLQGVNEFSFETNKFPVYGYDGVAMKVGVLLYVSTSHRDTLKPYVVVARATPDVVVKHIDSLPKVRGKWKRGKRIKIEKDAALSIHRSRLEPEDQYDLMANLDVITKQHRRQAIAIFAAGAIVGLIVMGIGFYDQNQPSNATRFLFHHTNMQGRAAWLNPPISKAGFACLLLSFPVIYWIKQKLRSYLTDLKINWPEVVKPGTVITASDFASGVFNATVDNVVFRVVAGNYEHTPPNSTRDAKKAIVPSTSVVLYEKAIPRAVKGEKLEEHLSGDVFDLSNVFDSLLVPMQLGLYTKLELHWEVQVLHDQLVDHEIVGPPEVFNLKAFKRGNGRMVF